MASGLRGSGRRWGALLVAVCVLGPLPVRASPPTVVEYWTIEANEGESAGGHAALRLGDVVHHVEHRGDGLVRDRRDARADFEDAYRGRENRAIRVLALEIPPAKAAALDARLRRRALERDLRLDRLETLDEEIRWLRRVIARGSLDVAVPGLALFDPRPGDCAMGAPTHAPARVRNRLDPALRGARRERSAAIAAASRATPSPHPGVFRRLLEATQLVAALEVIASCRPLAPTAMTAPRDRATVAPGDRAAWRGIADRLEGDLARLVSSSRADRGLALMLTWGRLQAARSTLGSHRWTLLDAFAEADGPPIALDTLPPSLRATRARAIEDRLEAARRGLARASTAPRLESWLDRVERLAHDAAHARTRTRHGGARPGGALQASRAIERPPRPVALPWPVGATLDALGSREADLVARRAALREELGASLGYDLFRRNCVTELLAPLDALALDPPLSPSLASFVPAVAHAELARHPSARRRPDRPGARALALRTSLDATATPRSHAATLLRESNTLTSRLYRPHARDSTFLLFAGDGPAAARPLAGLANLLWSSGASAFGLASAPFDGGDRLARGLRGWVMSVPELFFVPIRKGSYVVAPPIGETD